MEFFPLTELLLRDLFYKRGRILQDLYLLLLEEDLY